MAHLGDLRPDPRNARKHTARNQGQIAASIQRDGFGRSLLLANDGTIIAGNATSDAAATVGLDDVIVVETDGTKVIAVKRTDVAPDSPRFHRLAVADNRTAELAAWDAETLAGLIGSGDIAPADFWFPDELDAVLGGAAEPAAGQTDADAAPDPPAEPVTKPGDLWLLGRHRLLCGDSTVATDVVRLLDGVVPPLIVTDPPYGVEYDPQWRNEAAKAGHLGHADRRVAKVPNDNRVVWQEAWALCPSDVIYCWFPSWSAAMVQTSLETVGYQVRALIVWAKQTFAISRGHYHWQHEPCWYAVRAGATAHWIGDRSQTTLWEIAWDKNVEGGHSTQKPVECMARPLRNHDGDVYDPFLGSGTTLIAAELLGRRCFGMEIDPRYCDVIVRRWEQFAGGQATRADA